jgi:phosphoglucomutase
VNYRNEYEKWLRSEYFDEQTTNELKSIKLDEKEIEDRFYKSLDFGTAGMRGKLGAGTNRLNVYMIRRATKGLANYILENGEESRGVVIAYDCRNYSDVFALETAKTLAAAGIKAYLFTSLRPVPVLSYGVRFFNAQAGVCITASHNPKEYNGYKVYWEDGAQAVDEVASEIVSSVNKIVDYDEIEIMDEQEAIKKGLIVYIDKEVDDPYINDTKSLSSSKDMPKDINIVFTPIHGSGNIPVRRILDELGYENVCVVKEQEKPDGDFPTVDAPNPEDERVFDKAKKYASKKGAELIIGTDPDCDRVGMLILDDNGKFYRPNGNEIGALLFDYYLKANEGKLHKNGVLVKSIVTGDITRQIANKYSIKAYDVLTGFKYIGELIKNMEKTEENFIFGFEESYGYLAGTFVRDKDAVVASMLICDMCAYYKKIGKSMYQGLKDIYEEFGYFSETQLSIQLEGIEGLNKIKHIMDSFRKNGFPKIEGLNLSSKIDYLNDEIVDIESKKIMSTGLRKSNVLKNVYDGCSWITLRPSGTEPKIKVYASACEKTKKESLDKMNKMIETMKNAIDLVQ